MPTHIAGQSLLTLLIALPAIMALAIWLIPGLKRIARPVALITSLVVLAGAIGMTASFDFADAGTQQFTQVNAWIPAIGASYAVGVNGLGLVMVLLAALLTPLVILAAWDEVELPEGREGAEALGKRQVGCMALEIGR